MTKKNLNKWHKGGDASYKLALGRVQAAPRERVVVFGGRAWVIKPSDI